MNPDHRIEERLKYVAEQVRLHQLQMQAEAEIRHRERRERIATAALQGLLAKYGMGVHDDEMLDEAVEYADRLIARLDKEVKP